MSKELIAPFIILIISFSPAAAFLYIKSSIYLIRSLFRHPRFLTAAGSYRGYLPTRESPGALSRPRFAFLGLPKNVASRRAATRSLKTLGFESTPFIPTRESPGALSRPHFEFSA
jgi:hypothetical protein